MKENLPMNKYGCVAILAVKRAQNGENPVQAWKESAEKVFPSQPASRDKGCPKCAFLGLAENDLILGVPPGNYTTSSLNKKYAVEAVKLLRTSPRLTEGELWSRVTHNQPKEPNQQMDVVLALWNAGYIRTKN